MVGRVLRYGQHRVQPRADDRKVLPHAFTWTESMHMLDPIGIDRWPYELALKYGSPTQRRDGG